MESYFTQFNEIANKENNLVYHAIRTIHTRVVLCFKECLILLKNGYSEGATKIWRTMYELTIVASFIRKHSNDNELVQRYIDHIIIDNYKEESEYRKQSMTRQHYTDNAFIQMKKEYDIILFKSGDDMELIFEKVLERDIDLLMINKFITDDNILNLFLEKIGKSDYKVFSIQHSLMNQEDGESDITVIAEKDNHKIGLLIEDKIDAIAMPNQRERYNARGRKGIDNSQYDEFFVFMIAPSDYLKSNAEAQLYENQISYEELKGYFKNDQYATALIDKALEEKKNGYTIIENPNVTLFWEQYYTLIRQNFPDIKINEVHGPRGDNAHWPELTTYYPNIKIIQKSDRGFLDLTFSKMGNYPNVFHKYLDGKLEKDMYIKKTGKSMAVRIIIPIIDFGSSFDSQLENVKESLKQSLRLYKLLNMIDINSMYLEIENKDAEIKSISDFLKIYPSGIIVNYDLRVTYRCSTEKPEIIGNIVDYPYVQRYQTGVNPRTTLFIIKDNTLYRLVRLEINNPDSNYYIEDVKESIAESFYEDKEFLTNPNPPVNVFSEELLEIIDKEGQV